MAKFVNFGSLIMKKDKSGFYIKLDKDLELSINGDKFNGEYINVNPPTVKYDRMLDQGKITEEEYEKAVARFAKDGDLSFIRQELTAVVD